MADMWLALEAFAPPVAGVAILLYLTYLILRKIDD